VRVDCRLEPGVGEADVERWVQAASILHSNGDGQDIAVKDGRIVGVRGRAGDRVNHGRLGPKDLYGWQANRLAGPAHAPARPPGRRAGRDDWDDAMGRIVERSRVARRAGRVGGRFGFYTSGQLFLEEYYTLAVIGKAGLGTPHMCVDPRPTPVAKAADVHLAVRNGTNLALMNALLRELIAKGWVDDRYVEQHALGFEALATTVDAYPLDRAADICDVPAARIAEAAELVGTPSGCCRPCCRASTSPTRRRAAAARSTTCTCCAACSAARAPACCR
jgi:anaerobic selenocysteine-containing dehydrogenase